MTVEQMTDCRIPSPEDVDVAFRLVQGYRRCGVRPEIALEDARSVERVGRGDVLRVRDVRVDGDIPGRQWVEISDVDVVPLCDGGEEGVDCC